MGGKGDTAQEIMVAHFILQTIVAIPNPNRDFLKNSFRYSGAKLWNSLPIEAKVARSENVFKLNLH